MTNLRNQASVRNNGRVAAIGIALALGSLVVMVSIPGCQQASDVTTSPDPAPETIVADETDNLAEEAAVVSVLDPQGLVARAVEVIERAVGEAAA